MRFCASCVAPRTRCSEGLLRVAHLGPDQSCRCPDPTTPTARSRDSFGVAGTIDGERSAILRFSAV